MAAATSLASVPLQVPKKPTADALFSTSSAPKPCYSSSPISGSPSRNGKRHNISLAVASSASPSAVGSPSSPSTSGKPQIELEFVSPKPEADGSYQRQSATVDSGEMLLRNIMLDNKIDLYATYGKVMNCGGGGSCGTCIVQIIDGKELLNERTATENRYLKKKPESWRLACQTIVGNKEDSGKVVVQRLPQWRK
uniref:Chlorosome protein J n=1 Tax=Anthurium amnicola TaxID=1678845 RepID=A0A1D1YRN5_9ARAE